MASRLKDGMVRSFVNVVKMNVSGGKLVPSGKAESYAFLPDFNPRALVFERPFTRAEPFIIAQIVEDQMSTDEELALLLVKNEKQDCPVPCAPKSPDYVCPPPLRPRQPCHCPTDPNKKTKECPKPCSDKKKN